jgi:C4-dicarboxylate-specific signal transduction histidine kinase
MGYKPDIIKETGLTFFGKISASISHEIKNVLAVVSENAGLLEDLTLMADRGQPIDPARLKKMSATVKKQVARADEILKNMNRFAHSSDEAVANVDLNQTLELVRALTARFAAMQNVTVDLQLPASSPMIPTAPFFLMNLLCLCLDFAMSASGNDKQIALVAEEADNSVVIRIQGLAGMADKGLGTFPSEREKDLLHVLEANLTVDPERKEIVIRLSKITGVI